MKMKRARISIAILIAVLAILPCSFFLESASAAGPFDTKDFSVQVKVNENNTIQVKESILVNFQNPSQGIYRTIPYTGTFRMIRDGKEIDERVKAEIYDVSAGDDEVSTYTEEGTFMIRVGTEGKYITGPKQYHISYKVRFYKDSQEDFDYLYLNLIPSKWQSVIEKGKVRVEFPKEFAPSNVYLYQNDGKLDGEFARLEDGKVIVEANISDYYEDNLTIHTYLPEGYFKNVPDAADFGKKPALLALILLAISAVLWFLFGRDEKVVEVVEFRPPEGIDPMEMSYYLTGQASTSTIAPEIMYLGNQGYLEIEVLDPDSKKTGYILHKTDKDYKNENTHRKALMGKLFRGSASVNLENRDDDYWMSINDTEALVKNEIKNKKGFVRKTKASKISQALVLVFMFAIVGYTLIQTLRTPGSDELHIALMGIAGLIAIAGCLVLGRGFRTRYAKGKGKINGTMFAGIFLLILSTLMQMSGAFQVWNPAFALAVSLSILGVAFFRTIAGKATDELNRMNGRILGFKNFLSEVEVDKMKGMVDEDPNYFFNIMPYTYVFGFKDKWMKKFAGAVDMVPSWVRAADGSRLDTTDYLFGYYILSSMDNTIGSGITDAIKAEIGDTVGSSGGGGGFGGGGFGGGGGGSW